MEKAHLNGMLILAFIVVFAVSGGVQTFNSDVECDSACKDKGYDHGACMSNPPNGTLYPVIGHCNESVCRAMGEGYTCVCVCYNVSE